MLVGKMPRIALISLVAMTLSIGAIGGVTQPASAASVSVSVDPPTTTVQPGQSFDLTIKLTSDVPSRGVQFGLTFDPSLLEINKFATGPYYSDWAKANQATANEAIPFRADNANGKLIPGVVAIFGGSNAKAGPSGPGTLLTVTFSAKAGANGSTPITIENFVLSDTNALTVHGAKINNGNVGVGQAAAAAAAPWLPAPPPPAAAATTPAPAAPAVASPAATNPTPVAPVAPAPTATSAPAPSPAASPTSANAGNVAPTPTTAPSASGPGIPTTVPVVVPAGSPGIVIPWEAVGGFGGGILATASVLYALRRPES